MKHDVLQPPTTSTKHREHPLPVSGHVTWDKLHFTHTLTCFVSSSLANPAPHCDLGWTQSGSNCYKLKADTRKSWTSARYDCVSEGADLVSILSAEEEQFVTGMLDQSRFDLWIGLSTLVRRSPFTPFMWILHMNIESVNVNMNFVLTEMLQDSVSSRSGEHSIYLDWCSISGLHKLGHWSTNSVRHHILSSLII